MLPVIDRKWATIIGIIVFFVGFIFFPIGKYKSMLFLRKEYPAVAKGLIESYDNYILQKENLEKIQVSLDRSIDVNSINKILPLSLNVEVDNKKHTVHVKGSVSPDDVYKLVRLVTTTSNLKFEKLYINNPIAVPITVFPLNMANSIDVEAVIKYLEVKR